MKIKLTFQSKFILSTCILAASIYSCNPGNIGTLESGQKSHEILLDFDQAEDLGVSEFADRVSYLPLEYQEQSAIKSIAKIIFSRKNIFILDSRISKSTQLSLLCFDRNGKFLWGLEPNTYFRPELTSLSDVCLNSNGELVLLDPLGHQLSVWTQQGEFLRNQHLGFSAREFAIQGDLMWFHKNHSMYGREDSAYLYNLIVTDAKGVIQHKLQAFSPGEVGQEVVNISFSRSIYEVGRQVYFTQWLKDTLWELEPISNDLKPAFIYDAGLFHPSDEFLKKDPATQFMELYTNQDASLNVAIGPANIISDDQFLSYNYILNLRKSFWIRQKLSDNSVQVVERLIDDTSESEPLPFPRTFYADEMIGVIDLEFLEYYYPDFTGFPVSKDAMYQEILDGANPVLVFYQTK